MAFDAAQIAKELYGIDATVSSLPGEYDNNFHLRASDGREFVLKIMRENCDRAFIEMQISAMQHLGCNRIAGEVKQYSGRFVWILRWLPGKTLAETKPHSPELLRNLGRKLAEMDARLAAFDHSYAHRELKWDLARAEWICAFYDAIHDPSRRRIVERIGAKIPSLKGLRHSIIHGDVNDHNVIVSGDQIAGLIDYGDLHYSATACELAIACAYVALDNLQDPVAAIRQVVRGYEEVSKLEQREVELLFPLILTRLAVSVVNSAHRKKCFPDDPYVTVSEEPAWQALEQLGSSTPYGLT